MDYLEEEYLHLSAIENFWFCKRQWALKALEGQYGSNVYTTKGDIFHQNAHHGQTIEKRGNIITIRHMPVFSRTMGISGICDIVEFHAAASGVYLSNYDGYWDILPVEYKVGKKQNDRGEIAQLCAQALCLEEMFCTTIQEGAIFYGETRKKEHIPLTEELKNEINESYLEMHQLIKTDHVPKVKRKRNCHACSLYDICIPEIFERKSISKYMGEYV